MWYLAASLWQQASLWHSTTRVPAIPVPAVPSVEQAQPAETVAPERNLLAGTVRGLGVAKDLADLVCSSSARSPCREIVAGSADKLCSVIMRQSRQRVSMARTRGSLTVIVRH